MYVFVSVYTIKIIHIIVTLFDCSMYRYMTVVSFKDACFTDQDVVSKDDLLVRIFTIYPM